MNCDHKKPEQENIKHEPSGKKKSEKNMQNEPTNLLTKELSCEEHNSIPIDCQLDSYNYELPPEQIAQTPADKRNASRLLVLDRKKDQLHEDSFTNIFQHLPPNALIFANNSRVIPARIMGKRSTGGKVEFLLLTPLPLLKIKEAEAPKGCENTSDPWHKSIAEGLIKSSKQLKEGEEVFFSHNLHLRLVERFEYGQCKVELIWQGDLEDIMEEKGQLPLPPYIKREESISLPDDKIRYQTVYSKKDKAGSVAAPTAGLHFTEKLKDEIQKAGHEWVEGTLYVGYGTFSPVRTKDIREHKMHSEYVELSQETADILNKAKREKRPIVAVGTTSVRILEGIAQKNKNKEISAYKGWVNIFIYPGSESSRFSYIDALITNFHLPESSLLLLVSSLAGRKKILDAYSYAVENKFRFFSYGDAMLIK